MRIRAFANRAAIMVAACVVVAGSMEAASMRTTSIHVSAAAAWQAGTLRASLRVALHVTQRQDRASASNRYGAVQGLRDRLDSQGSRIEGS
jgi:hypothetical protein